jgi:hypothetical protein
LGIGDWGLGIGDWCKNFPFTEEFEIKWVYYQFMDYFETYKYFSQGENNSKKNVLENIISSARNDNNNSSSKSFYSSDKITSTNKNTTLKSSSPDLSNILYKIISEKPMNWKIENNIKNININDYQDIRRKLIWQAQLAWRSGRHQEAKVIIAKARRYKQEINSLLENKKISLFMKNNENNSTMNFFNNKENFIDLHGLSYEESKIIINKKISDIKRKKNLSDINPGSKFILNIITGVGHHSKNNQPVLLPRLSAFLKRSNYKVKAESERGVIKVYL